MWLFITGQLFYGLTPDRYWHRKSLEWSSQVPAKRGSHRRKMKSDYDDNSSTLAGVDVTS